MLDNEFKKEYLRTIGRCNRVLFRHPQRSMAERLQSIIPLSMQYSDVDVYGQGALINDFEKEVANLLGHEAGIFLPSGTMAQVMALRIWADKQQCNKVAFHSSSHLELHEKNAYQQLYGLEAILVGHTNKVITCDDLLDIDCPISSLLLELPMREIGGQLPNWDELVKQSEWAKKNNIALHLDGARLWACTDFYQKTLAEISELFDSVYVSFYKDLDGIAGAMLVGTESFIEIARIWSRRAGGNLITMFPDVLAAKLGIDQNLPLVHDFVKKAKSLANIFNQKPLLETIPLIPPSNLFHLTIMQPEIYLLPKIKRWSEQNNIALVSLPRKTLESSCLFEITIGKNALKLSDKEWQIVIDNFYEYILET
jgi:threonine aldolase